MFLFTLTDSLEAEKSQPNVVVIMADDLGYHDLGCYGHPKIKTPVLDQLAASGMRLTDFYSGATVCTPSRIALLTGAYPPRLGWSKGVVGYMIPTNQGLSPQALTMAEVFKTSGYATGIFGKWHLGDRPSFRPHRQGFDHNYYVNKSNNQTTKIWNHDVVVEVFCICVLYEVVQAVDGARVLEVAREHIFFGVEVGTLEVPAEVFLKWVEPETPPTLKKNDKYAFLASVALYFSAYF